MLRPAVSAGLFSCVEIRGARDGAQSHMRHFVAVQAPVAAQYSPMLLCKVLRGFWYLVYLRCRPHCAAQSPALNKSIFKRPSQRKGTILRTCVPSLGDFLNGLLFLTFSYWDTLALKPATTACRGPIFESQSAICAWLVSRKTSNACRKRLDCWAIFWFQVLAMSHCPKAWRQI